MRSWNQTPVVRFLPAFLGGMYCGFTVHVPWQWVLICSSLPLLTWLSSFSFSWYHSFKFRLVSGLNDLALVFFLAWLLTVFKTETSYRSHFQHYTKGDLFLARLTEEPVEKSSSVRVIAEVFAVKSQSNWRGTEGKVLVYFRKGKLSQFPGYGDCIVFRKPPEVVKGPPNPDQFDFRAWLEAKQTFHQVNLGEGEFSVVAKNQGSGLVSWAIALRQKWMSVFRTCKIEGQEYAVLSALILGNDDEIDQDTMQAYAASGALHILSVSGMHLGIIYGALQILLGFLSRNRKTRIVRTILIILFLWFYALITGLSPSVLRSAMMLSFIVIGQTLERSTNTFNTLAASMIALFVMFSPHLILQAGFQLSYLAVAGILFLYKPIYSRLGFTSWLGNQVWTILAVSIAAQLATFPLSLYYFHQFPNYFLPANLAVIPESTVVIFGGIALILCSPLPLVSGYLSVVVGKSVWLLNASAAFVQHLPFSVSSGIHLSVIEMMVLYGFLLFASLYFLELHKGYLFFSMLLCIVYLGFRLFYVRQIQEQQEVVIYQIPGHSFLQFLQGHKGIAFMDTGMRSSNRSWMMNCKNYEIRRGFFSNNTFHDFGECRKEGDRIAGFLTRSGPWYLFSGNKIFVLQSSTTLPEKEKFNADLVFVSGKVRLKKDLLLQAVQTSLVVADGSVPSYIVKELKAKCKTKGVNFYSTTESGAFIWKIR